MIKRYVLTEQYDEDNFRKIVNKLERDDHMGDLVKYEDVEELINPWKDASKEKPEEDPKYLLYSKTVMCIADGMSDPIVAYWSEKWSEWMACVGNMQDLNVTHWMYIPEVNNED